MSHPASGDPQQTYQRTILEEISIIEDGIRRQPVDASRRWALFQWLCIASQWDRAIRQLQVFGQLDAGSLPLVQACRDLIRAERWRERVLLGLQAPGYVLDEPPAWMPGLVAALALTGHGELAAAEGAREKALDAAPLTGGRAGEVDFDWIADSDSRLGPVCEIMTAGSYRWLAFADAAVLQIAQPATLMDLVWAKCSVTLRDGTVLRGFMPARYLSPVVGDVDTDRLAMGHQTVWRETGRVSIVAAGRKTWTTSAGDIGLFEWPDCRFAGSDATSGAAIRESTLAAGTAFQ
ncbi:type VI secretion system accessory protein TagJ [Paraburkholderia caribensis]|uniref:type VI secretion system accessory protein TagJ n=1 Tax=Paraburkholderia caribensis TaxID=75105 RepID=UPI001D075663|nr:type VI secretion system accessory protein TagJ [Paraburkholderia caribensis]